MTPVSNQHSSYDATLKQMSNPVATQSIIELLARRRLALPALLFLTGLQPLHFAIGHLLLLVAPLTDLLGLKMTGTWGAQLSDPGAAAMWRQWLTQVAAEAEEQTRA
ncbi:MAG TPA: hypothetical protein GYA08_08520 [Chloroflexi bacterium]|nr:hypothetical protein [Chloroflexota bacterium]